jgi:hypothetical protein
MTKTAGSSDNRPRARRRKTESEKADTRRLKETKKRKSEAELRDKNRAKVYFSAPSARRNEPDADQSEPPDMRDGSDVDAPYHALVTGTNKFREIRLQALTVVTDTHDQLRPALRPPGRHPDPAWTGSPKVCIH